MKLELKRHQYRQGDVAIRAITALPAGLKPVPLEGGRVILAHGEVTGHAHCFTPEQATKFTGPKGEEYFEIKGKPLCVRLPILRQWQGQVLVQHPTEGAIEFALADITVRKGVAIIDGRFGLLKHDEHTQQGIPAGFYEGGNGVTKTVRQREYSPEENRNVAD